MTPEQLLREHDACIQISRDFPAHQPCAIRHRGKTWYVCHFSLESFTVLFVVYLGPRGGRSARVTVLDDSRQVDAADRISIWSSEHWLPESLLCIGPLFSSESKRRQPSEEKIAAHLRARVEFLLANPRETIEHIRTLISQLQTWPLAHSVDTLPGGATGLKR